MTSVQSAIATVPMYSKTLYCVANTSNYIVLPTTSTANVTGVVGSQIYYNSTANAAAIGSSTGTAFSSGDQLRDMGQRVHIFGNGQHVYTLSLVQSLSASDAEGAGGATNATNQPPGNYNTGYVITWAAGDGTVATSNCTVVRVGGN